jgi:(p)ppGpp synthase/HD superfamily hydrolase
MEQVLRALTIAIDAHRGQVRRTTGAPYITHILDVTKHLLNERVEEHVIIAGILHDTLEDTDINPERIKKEFGEAVLKLVEFATEPDNTQEKTVGELKKSWHDRKQATLQKAATGTHEELIILLADKLSNLSSIREDLEHIGLDVWNHFHAQDHEIIRHYEDLTNIFAQRLPHLRLRKLFEQEVTHMKTAHQRAKERTNNSN